MERADEIEAVIAARQGGIRTANFLLQISLRDRKKVVRSCHKVVPLYKVYLVGGPDPLSSVESPLPFSLMILAHRTLCSNPSRELSSKLGLDLVNKIFLFTNEFFYQSEQKKLLGPDRIEETGVF